MRLRDEINAWARRVFGHASLSVPAFPPQPWTATHRHKKGGLYRHLGTAMLEADRSAVVIYDDVDGTVWVRDQLEFEDGRFTPIDQT